MEYVKDDNNVGMFSFGYSSTDVAINEEDIIYPLPSFVAEVGGALGLFLGFSFISGVELFYWLTIRLGKNIRNSNGSVNSDFKSSTSSSRASWIQVEEASTEINSIEK